MAPRGTSNTWAMHEATASRFRHAATAVAVLGFGLTLSVVAALPALAHTFLVSSNPAEGALVEAPTDVELVFSEALIDVGGELSVLAADGASTALVVTYPSPEIAAANLPALPAGTTVIAWRVVSGDGHPVEGTLTFEVTAPPQADASEGPQPVVSPAPSPTASPSAELVATPISAQAQPAGGLPAWLWAALISVVVVATCVAMATSKRR